MEKRKEKKIKTIKNQRTKARLRAAEEELLLTEDATIMVAELVRKKTQPETLDSPKNLTRANAAAVRVAILSEEGFEEIELTSPKKALEQAGAKVDVISPHIGKIKAWDHDHWSKEIKVDKDVNDARAEEYDALVLPGGVMNPDKLRQNKTAISLIKQFIKLGKPIAAICHGLQSLIETGMIRGKTMTSYPSLKTDLRNAGVNWVDRKVVHFGQFITSRKPDDLDAFNHELLCELALIK